MNKNEALERLTKAEQEIAECKKILQAPDKVESSVFYPEVGQIYSYIRQMGGNYTKEVGTEHKLNVSSTTMVAFRTPQIARDFAEAFQVMLELRACEGVAAHEAASIGKQRYCIKIFGGKVMTDVMYDTEDNISFCFSPLFDRATYAGAAIQKVGPDRIKKAMETLCRA